MFLSLKIILGKNYIACFFNCIVNNFKNHFKYTYKYLKDDFKIKELFVSFHILFK